MPRYNTSQKIITALASALVAAAVTGTSVQAQSTTFGYNYVSDCPDYGQKDPFHECHNEDPVKKDFYDPGWIPGAGPQPVTDVFDEDKGGDGAGGGGAGGGHR